MHFAMTSEGYLDAKKYLEGKGISYKMILIESDGYSVVAFANSQKDKEYGKDQKRQR